MTQFSVATFAAAVVTGTFTSGVAAQKVRMLRQNDQPITSRLLPDDGVVVIEHMAGPPRPSPFTWTRDAELKDLASWEEVAVIDQARPQSFFVMNGAWLNTRVQARVMQTLKTGRLATAPGKLIEFEHDGGELEVNGVIVRSSAGVSFENAKRYLVAIRFHPDLQKWQVGMMFELDNLGVLREHSAATGRFRTAHSTV